MPSSSIMRIIQPLIELTKRIAFILVQYCEIRCSEAQLLISMEGSELLVCSIEAKCCGLVSGDLVLSTADARFAATLNQDSIRAKLEPGARIQLDAVVTRLFEAREQKPVNSDASNATAVWVLLVPCILILLTLPRITIFIWLSAQLLLRFSFIPQPKLALQPQIYFMADAVNLFAGRHSLAVGSLSVMKNKRMTIVTGRETRANIDQQQNHHHEASFSCRRVLMLWRPGGTLITAVQDATLSIASALEATVQCIDSIFNMKTNKLLRFQATRCHLTENCVSGLQQGLAYVRKSQRVLFTNQSNSVHLYGCLKAVALEIMLPTGQSCLVNASECWINNAHELLVTEVRAVVDGHHILGCRRICFHSENFILRILEPRLLYHRRIVDLIINWIMAQLSGASVQSKKVLAVSILKATLTLPESRYDRGRLEAHAKAIDICTRGATLDILLVDLQALGGHATRAVLSLERVQNDQMLWTRHFTFRFLQDSLHLAIDRETYALIFAVILGNLADVPPLVYTATAATAAWRFFLEADDVSIDLLIHSQKIGVLSTPRKLNVHLASYYDGRFMSSTTFSDGIELNSLFGNCILRGSALYSHQVNRDRTNINIDAVHADFALDVHHKLDKFLHYFFDGFRRAVSVAQDVVPPSTAAHCKDVSITLSNSLRIALRSDAMSKARRFERHRLCLGPTTYRRELDNNLTNGLTIDAVLETRIESYFFEDGSNLILTPFELRLAQRCAEDLVQPGVWTLSRSLSCFRQSPIESESHTDKEDDCFVDLAIYGPALSALSEAIGILQWPPSEEDSTASHDNGDIWIKALANAKERNNAFVSILGTTEIDIRSFRLALLDFREKRASLRVSCGAQFAIAHLADTVEVKADLTLAVGVLDESVYAPAVDPLIARLEAIRTPTEWHIDLSANRVDATVTAKTLEMLRKAANDFFLLSVRRRLLLKPDVLQPVLSKTNSKSNVLIESADRHRNILLRHRVSGADQISIAATRFSDQVNSGSMNFLLEAYGTDCSVDGNWLEFDVTQVNAGKENWLSAPRDGKCQSVALTDDTLTTQPIRLIVLRLNETQTTAISAVVRLEDDDSVVITLRSRVSLTNHFTTRALELRLDRRRWSVAPKSTQNLPFDCTDGVIEARSHGCKQNWQPVVSLNAALSKEPVIQQKFVNACQFAIKRTVVIASQAQESFFSWGSAVLESAETQVDVLSFDESTKAVQLQPASRQWSLVERHEIAPAHSISNFTLIPIAWELLPPYELRSDSVKDRGVLAPGGTAPITIENMDQLNIDSLEMRVRLINYQWSQPFRIESKSNRVITLDAVEARVVIPSSSKGQQSEIESIQVAPILRLFLRRENGALIISLRSVLENRATDISLTYHNDPATAPKDNPVTSSTSFGNIKQLFSSSQRQPSTQQSKKGGGFMSMLQTSRSKSPVDVAEGAIFKRCLPIVHICEFSETSSNDEKVLQDRELNSELISLRIQQPHNSALFSTVSMPGNAALTEVVDILCTEWGVDVLGEQVGADAKSFASNFFLVKNVVDAFADLNSKLALTTSVSDLVDSEDGTVRLRICHVLEGQLARQSDRMKQEELFSSLDAVRSQLVESWGRYVPYDPPSTNNVLNTSSDVTALEEKNITLYLQANSSVWSAEIRIPTTTTFIDSAPALRYGTVLVCDDESDSTEWWQVDQRRETSTSKKLEIIKGNEDQPSVTLARVAVCALSLQTYSAPRRFMSLGKTAPSQSPTTYELCMNIVPTHTSCSVVTFLPRMSIRNELDVSVDVAQSDSAFSGAFDTAPIVRLEPGEEKAVHWPNADLPTAAAFRLDGRFDSGAISCESQNVAPQQVSSWNPMYNRNEESASSNVASAEKRTGGGSGIDATNGPTRDHTRRWMTNVSARPKKCNAAQATTIFRVRGEPRVVLEKQHKSTLCGVETLVILEPVDRAWPPHRIENRTSRVIRFQQRRGGLEAKSALAIADKLLVSSATPLVENISVPNEYGDEIQVNTTEQAALTSDVALLPPCRRRIPQSEQFLSTVLGSKNDSTKAIPWIVLKPYESIHYAWERPVDVARSGRRMVTVEFFDDSTSTWGVTRVDVGLDDPVGTRHKNLRVRLPPPDLSDALHVGLVDRRHQFLPESWMQGSSVALSAAGLFYVCSDQGMREVVNVLDALECASYQYEPRKSKMMSVTEWTQVDNNELHSGDEKVPVPGESSTKTNISGKTYVRALSAFLRLVRNCDESSRCKTQQAWLCAIASSGKVRDPEAIFRTLCDEGFLVRENRDDEQEEHWKIQHRDFDLESNNGRCFAVVSESKGAVASLRTLNAQQASLWVKKIRDAADNADALRTVRTERHGTNGLSTTSTVSMIRRSEGPTKVLEIIETTHQDSGDCFVAEDLRRKCESLLSRFDLEQRGKLLKMPQMQSLVLKRHGADGQDFVTDNLDLKRKFWLTMRCSTLSASFVRTGASGREIEQLLSPKSKTAIGATSATEALSSAHDELVTSKEILTLTLCDVDFRRLVREDRSVETRLRIEHGQIDNQLSARPLFCVAVRPSSAEDDEERPALWVRISQRPDLPRINRQHSVLYIDAFVVRLRPLDLNVDHELAAQIVAMCADIISAAATHKDTRAGIRSHRTVSVEMENEDHLRVVFNRRSKLNRVSWCDPSWPVSFAEFLNDPGFVIQKDFAEASLSQWLHDRLTESNTLAISSALTKSVFCGALRLHALEACVTLQGGVSLATRVDVSKALGPAASAQFDATLAMLGQLDEANFSVADLFVNDAYAPTAEGLGRRVARHYTFALLRQIHRALGLFDVVKTPFAFIRDLGSGVQDFFWQPIEGAFSLSTNDSVPPEETPNSLEGFEDNDQQQLHTRQVDRAEINFFADDNIDETSIFGLRSMRSSAALIPRRGDQEAAKAARQATISAQGLASGVARGTTSLVGSALDGGLTVASSICDGIGGAVAALSMDTAYTTRRVMSRAAEQRNGRVVSRRTLHRSRVRSTSTLSAVTENQALVEGNGALPGSEIVESGLVRARSASRALAARKPKRSAHGLILQGAKELGTGLFDGVTGVVLEPYRAANSNPGDYAGIARATARGILGVAVKPAVGVLDFGGNLIEGVRHAGRFVGDGISEVLTAQPQNNQGTDSDSRMTYDSFDDDDEADDDEDDENELGFLNSHPSWQHALDNDISSCHGRLRHPRVFDSFGRLLQYDGAAAAAQQIARMCTPDTSDSVFDSLKNDISSFESSQHICLLFHTAITEKRLHCFTTSWGGPGSLSTFLGVPDEIEEPRTNQQARLMTRTRKRWLLCLSLEEEEKYDVLRYVEEQENEDGTVRTLWEVPLAVVDAIVARKGQDELHITLRTVDESTLKSTDQLVLPLTEVWLSDASPRFVHDAEFRLRIDLTSKLANTFDGDIEIALSSLCSNFLHGDRGPTMVSVYALKALLNNSAWSFGVSASLQPSKRRCMCVLVGSALWLYEAESKQDAFSAFSGRRPSQTYGEGDLAPRRVIPLRNIVATVVSDLESISNSSRLSAQSESKRISTFLGIDANTAVHIAAIPSAVHPAAGTILKFETNKNKVDWDTKRELVIVFDKQEQAVAWAADINFRVTASNEEAHLKVQSYVPISVTAMPFKEREMLARVISHSIKRRRAQSDADHKMNSERIFLTTERRFRHKRISQSSEIESEYGIPETLPLNSDLSNSTRTSQDVKEKDLVRVEDRPRKSLA